MMTGAELKAAGMISVEHGWIILRNGQRFEDQLYPTEQAARASARCFPGSGIAKSRRVRTIYRKRPDWIIGEAS
jgi:hypothetical protein